MGKNKQNSPKTQQVKKQENPQIIYSITMSNGVVATNPEQVETQNYSVKNYS